MRLNFMRRGVAAGICVLIASGATAGAGGAEKESVEQVFAAVKEKMKDNKGVLSWLQIAEANSRRPANEAPSMDSDYSRLAELIYNYGERDLALRLLEAADMKALRRRLAKYELDVATLEASYRAQIDSAIAEGNGFLPDDILEDRVMIDRVLTAYVGQLEKARSPALYELLRRAFTEKTILVEVCREQLKVVPEDERVVNDYLYACTSTKSWAELLNEANLPKGMTAWPRYQQAKAEALLETGRRDEAVLTMDHAAAAFPQQKWPSWKPLAELYLKAGEKEKAAMIARAYGMRSNYDAAEILAEAGDKAGVVMCVKDALASELPPDYLILIAKACWKVGDNELAEQVFDETEKRAIKAATKERRPSFSGVVHYYYQQRGRMARYFEKVFPIAAKQDEDAFTRWVWNFSWEFSKSKEQIAEAKGVFEKLEPEFGTRWQFMVSRARALQAMKEYAAASEQCGKALARLDELKFSMQSEQMQQIRVLRLQCDEENRRLIAATLPAPAAPVAAAPVAPPVVVPAAPARPRIPPEELDKAKKEMEASPTEGKWHGRYAIALMLAGRIADARSETRKAVELGGVQIGIPFRYFDSFCGNEMIAYVSTRSYFSVQTLATLYAEAGMAAGAEQDLAPAMKSSKRIERDVLLQIAEVRASRLDLLEAKKNYERLVEIDPWGAADYRKALEAINIKILHRAI